MVGNVRNTETTDSYKGANLWYSVVPAGNQNPASISIGEAQCVGPTFADANYLDFFIRVSIAMRDADVEVCNVLMNWG